MSSRLAVGNTHIVTGSPFGGFGWMDIGTTGVAEKGQRSILTLMDLDARGDAVAVLGADSGEVQGLARDGVIAWIGSLSKNLQDMKPLMKGRSSPGGKDMARCGFLESGAIRFMRDGSLIILPGVEPGAYRYDASGKLLQTWDTKPFGIIDDCDVQPTQLALLGSDFGSRIAWLSSRVRVDEILPLANGAALLLRRVEGGVTRWELVTLPFRGKSQRVDLPISVPTPRGSVRGDVRGNEMALLVYDVPLPSEKPEVKPAVYVIAIDGQ